MQARSVHFRSAFAGNTPAMFSNGVRTSRSRPTCGMSVMAKTSLEFIKGIEETTVPEVRLTRSSSGKSGTAMFRFVSPTVIDKAGDVGDITGLYMIDEEGTIRTVDVSAKFVNGTLEAIEAKYTMKTLGEWDRFMRFMERYASENGLGFQKN